MITQSTQINIVLNKLDVGLEEGNFFALMIINFINSMTLLNEKKRFKRYQVNLNNFYAYGIYVLF